MGERLNFSKISALVLDADRFSTGIVSNILRGFGLTDHIAVESGHDAKKLLDGGRFHLLLTEALLPDMVLCDLVNWIRHHKNMTLRTMPIVVLTGYAQFSKITSARDCGVNSVVRKPVSPAVLYDHIAWSAHTDRPFVEADQYAGPCRRFHFNNAAPGLNRRLSDHPDDAMPDDHATAQEHEGVS